jgi:transcriptional regulator
MEMQYASEVLRKRGFTQEEIARLSELRATLRKHQMQEAAAMQRRFEFARWLVATGRLTEQLA